MSNRSRIFGSCFFYAQNRKILKSASNGPQKIKGRKFKKYFLKRFRFGRLISPIGRGAVYCIVEHLFDNYTKQETEMQ